MPRPVAARRAASFGPGRGRGAGGGAGPARGRRGAQRARLRAVGSGDAAARPAALASRRARRAADAWGGGCRSEEHTSELQSLMRISYAVFGLKNNTKTGY